MQPAVLDVFRPPAQNSARRTYKRGITPHPYKPHDGISRRNRPIHKMTLYKSSPNFKPRIAIRLAASLPSFDLRRINIRTRQETMMVVVPHWTEIVLSVYTQKAKKMYEVLRMLCDLQHKTNWGVEVYFLAVSASAFDEGRVVGQFHVPISLLLGTELFGHYKWWERCEMSRMKPAPIQPLNWQLSRFPYNIQCLWKSGLLKKKKKHPVFFFARQY